MNIKADKFLFIERYSHTLFFGFFIIGLLLSLLYSNHQIVSGNQEQMLDKGYLGASQGIWLSYGNAASAIGNVPGSLSAYIVGIPLTLWFSPWAPMLFLLLLHILSFYLLDSVIKHWLENAPDRYTRYLVFVIPYFVLVNLIAAHDSEKFSYAVSYQQQVLEYINTKTTE